ncbi:MAG: OmpA family protein [Candidatus Adiutrix sp.]|jgi:outer membrane protein OmpA-like peptidoglycan-associated protein|nr:OmpA family protein [Candidatus Adiutrix sp.]
MRVFIDIFFKCPSRAGLWRVWAALWLAVLLPGDLAALSNHGDYYPHGWLKPDLYGAKKISDIMIDFDPAVEGEETRREEFLLANDAGRSIRLSHNGRVFCYVTDVDLYDPWTFQIVDYDGSGAFEMKEPAFSDFPLPRWTFINHPFLTLRTADYTGADPSVSQLIQSLLGPEPRPCKKKYTPEQRAALAVARGGEMPPDECLPEPYAADDGPRVALNILFEFDRDTLTARARQTLNILGQAMSSRELAGATFRLEGHTDAVGGFNYNMDLSRRRANTVQRYLAENFGFSSRQLIPEGHGESRPLPNIDPEDGRNRRVEVVNLSAGRMMTMADRAYQDLPPDPYRGRGRR